MFFFYKVYGVRETKDVGLIGIFVRQLVYVCTCSIFSFPYAHTILIYCIHTQVALQIIYLNQYAFDCCLKEDVYQMNSQILNMYFTFLNKKLNF